MKLKYKGVMNGFFRLPNGGGFNVERGQVYNIPDNFSDSLIKSSSWEKVNSSSEAIKESTDIAENVNKHSSKRKNKFNMDNSI